VGVWDRLGSGGLGLCCHEIDGCRVGRRRGAGLSGCGVAWGLADAGRWCGGLCSVCAAAVGGGRCDVCGGVTWCPWIKCWCPDVWSVRSLSEGLVGGQSVSGGRVGRAAVVSLWWTADVGERVSVRRAVWSVPVVRGARGWGVRWPDPRVVSPPFRGSFRLQGRCARRCRLWSRM